jgi:hypothetical protein
MLNRQAGYGVAPLPSFRLQPAGVLADHGRLTKMPTIATLVDSGAIKRIDVELHPREQPQRLLYGTPGFIVWLEERVTKNEKSPLFLEISPLQQLDNLFYEFVSGRPLVFSRQFRFVRAESNAVWEMKTPDLRVFGWFMKRDCFVAVFGDWTNHVKDFALYRGYRLEVRRLRRELGVEDDLCVKGLEPDDVLSS